MIELLYFALFFIGLSGAIAAPFMFLRYTKKLRKIRERLEARAMHEELDRMEMQDVMERGDWR